MKILLILLAGVFVFYGCAKQLNPAEKEEARRASLELNSVMDMASARQISPVEFESGSARLLESSRPLLDRVAEVLLKHNRLKLIVSGHTDDVGSDEYNEDLSQKRASAVKMYLATQGVHPDSVRVYGYGEKMPVVKDTTEAARALNRRVEFRITTRDWGAVY
ncbi:MAG: OmpA family protein [Elusimicrobiota bacterium]|nr:OmpA family protein [Elusimicrobiota bacterium]